MGTGTRSPLKGAGGFGGSGSGTQVQTPDTLHSDDSVEVILGVSEGPIKGFVDGARSMIIGDTPLLDVTGKPNFGNFDLRLHIGSNPAAQIIPNLGGTGASTSVGVQLEMNTPVTRSGSYTQIDFLEIRMVFNQLLVTNDKGTFPATAKFNVEIKPHSSSTWNSAYPTTIPPSYEQFFDTYFQQVMVRANGIFAKGTENPAYRELFIQPNMPGAPSDLNAYWFDSDDNNKPYYWKPATTTWVALDATLHTTDTYSYWEWDDPPIIFFKPAIHRKAYFGFVDNAPPIALGQYDIWIAPAGTYGGTDVVGYIWNGSAWVNYMDWADPPLTTPGIVEITGKTTAPYVKELRFKVDRIDEPYDIRVTKLSQENTTEYFCDLVFESFQELVATPLRFDDLAVVHLTMKSSNQFSNVPEFNPILDGRVIRVPTNYDPDTRIYTGIWDGTFKLAYSRNPAWCAYDVATNTRYGLASYTNVTLDKYAVYAFGQHCDAHGFTYNDYVQEPRDLTEMIDYICGIAGGKYIDQGDGFATIIFDADDQPAEHLFTQENVVEGIFTYAFSDITSRKNDITVSFVNENYNWIEDRRRVFSQDHIDTYGRNPEEFIAVGCIDETEAVKRARLRLMVSLTEKTVVTFKTNRQGLHVPLYGIILIADPDSGFGISGRLNSVINSTTLKLRDPVYFEAGFTYKIIFSIPVEGGFNLVEYNLTTSAGSTDVLTLASPLTVDLPEYCTFAIESADVIGVPKAWRITNIDEVDGDPDNVSISALEVNRNKWAFVDGAYTPITPSFTGNVDPELLPPTGIVITPRNDDGHHYVDFSWTPSGSPLVRFSRLYQQYNGGDILPVLDTRQAVWTLADPLPGIYRFALVTVGLDGRESASALRWEHIIADTQSVRSVEAVANLKIVGSAAPGVFAVRDPQFVWDQSTDPYRQKYRVRILDASTHEMVREEFVTEPTYIYSFTNNTLDFGTARREFDIEVRTVDAAGTVSPSAMLHCSNPAPAPPTIVVLTERMFMMYATVARSAETDLAGMHVHVSDASGFTPGPANLIYDGPNTTCRTAIADGEQLYARVAFYDDFDGTISGYSDEVSITGSGLLPDSVSYDKLTEELRDTIDTVEDTVVEVSALATEFYGSWTVKIQTQNITTGGSVKTISGFGLAQATHDGEVTSDFVVQADRFSVIPTYDGITAQVVKPVFVVSSIAGQTGVGISGDMFIDGSITARSLQINGAMANFIANGDFEDGLNDWMLSDPVHTTLSTDAAAGSGAAVLDRQTATPGTGAQDITTRRFIPVRTGVPYECLATIKGDSASATGFTFRVKWYDDTQTQLTAGSAYTDVFLNAGCTTSYVQLASQVTPPASARFAKIQLFHLNTSSTQRLWLDGLGFKAATGGTSITPGGITADKLNVTDLSSVSADVGILTAGKLQSSDGGVTTELDLTTGKFRTKDGVFSGTLDATRMTAGARLQLGPGAELSGGQLPYGYDQYTTSAAGAAGGEAFTLLTPGFIWNLKRNRIVSTGKGESFAQPLTIDRKLSAPVCLAGNTAGTATWLMPTGLIAQTANTNTQPASNASGFGEVHPVYWDPFFYLSNTNIYWALGFDYYVTVPAGVTTLSAALWGGGGATYNGGPSGGPGGFVSGDYPVSEGDLFVVRVPYGGAWGDGRQSTFSGGILFVETALRGWAEAGQGLITNYTTASGGGRAMIAKVDKATLTLTPIFIAGGGGAGHAGVAGTSGGPASAGVTGGQGVGVPQGANCTGTNQGAGGGGYEGGSLGKGGTNYLDPAVTNQVSLAGTTGGVPPQITHAAYLAHIARMGTSGTPLRNPGYGMNASRQPIGPTVMSGVSQISGAPGLISITFT